jgi:benzil reductase ((S)-benzoin forming)
MFFPHFAKHGLLLVCRFAITTAMHSALRLHNPYRPTTVSRFARELLWLGFRQHRNTGMKAIVTGHSRGLGAAIAATLLARGIPVLGLARHRNDGLASPLLEQQEIDLADTAALARWLADGGLAGLESEDVLLLVNNAGIVQPVGPLDTQPIDQVGTAVMLNVGAPLMLAAALTQLAPVAEKRILHVSSGAARGAYPGWSVYCATKAALDHHARAVALDADPNVRICSLAPGVIDTDMQHEIRATPLERFPIRERFDALKREGKLMQPEQCGQRLVDYLLDQAYGKVPVADLRELG